MKSKASLSLSFTLLGTAVLIVCFNAWLAFHSVQALSASQLWVSHTWRVLDSFDAITDSLKDAETGTRGYLLSGEDVYLLPFNQSKADLPGEIDTSMGLVVDNPQEESAVRELREVIMSRMSLLEQSIEERKTGKTSSLHLLVLNGTGLAEMDHVRSLIATMQRTERGLLAQRVQGWHHDGERARETVIFASVVDLLLVLLMFRFILSERHLRQLADQSSDRLEKLQSISEHRAEEVRSLNAELEQRVRQRTADLEAANRELEAFSYSVSHDLRAPLRTVDGFSLALQEDYAAVIDGDGKDYLRRIRDGVQRMGQLIDSLLQLSRITRAELTEEAVDLSALAETVAAELAAQNPDRTITFKIEPGLECMGDFRLLRASFENLLGNAVKFTARKPDARIEFGHSGTAYFIRDNGAGFDMRYADKLFTAFNRLHGDADFRGSGIGLATVARIVRRHRGTIWAGSEVGQGATFWFTLG